MCKSWLSANTSAVVCSSTKYFLRQPFRTNCWPSYQAFLASLLLNYVLQHFMNRIANRTTLELRARVGLSSVSCLFYLEAVVIVKRTSRKEG